jgi:adenylate kinase
MNNYTFLLFFGAPGSGKGTQAQLLGKKLKFPVISTGDLIRQEIKAGSKLGSRIEKDMAAGKLASDSVVKNLLNARVNLGDIVSGALFDGYPRRPTQQKFLIHELDLLSHHHDKVWAVLIDVSDQEVMRRLGGRRVCYCGQTYHLHFNPPKVAGHCNVCGKRLHIRPEDNPKSIKLRLRLYHEQIEKLLTYWKHVGRLIVVNGEQDIKLVQADLTKAIKKHKLLK